MVRTSRKAPVAIPDVVPARPDWTARSSPAAERSSRRITGYSLAELRNRRGVTQIELASRLRMLQSAVSRFERQDDALISTLARYVDGLGGHLVLRAQFVDEEEISIRIPVAAVRRDDIRPDSQRPDDGQPARRDRR